MLNSECLEVFNKYLVEVKRAPKIPSVLICEMSGSLETSWRPIRLRALCPQPKMTSQSILTGSRVMGNPLPQCREPLLRLSACMAYYATAAM